MHKCRDLKLLKTEESSKSIWPFQFILFLKKIILFVAALGLHCSAQASWVAARVLSSYDVWV